VPCARVCERAWALEFSFASAAGRQIWDFGSGELVSTIPWSRGKDADGSRPPEMLYAAQYRCDIASPLSHAWGLPNRLFT
jgi:hypothetical protein